MCLGLNSWYMSNLLKLPLYTFFRRMKQPDFFLLYLKLHILHSSIQTVRFLALLVLPRDTNKISHDVEYFHFQHPSMLDY